MDESHGLLIVNADDWGQTEPVTDAILECARAGLISSATAMVYMADSNRAADLAEDLDIGVGLHLNLTAPFTDPNTPAEVRERQARLVDRFKSLGLNRWIYNPLIRGEVEQAILDQMDRFRVLYRRPPTHYDGHHHVHICPTVALSGALSSGSKVRKSVRSGWGDHGRATRVATRLRERATQRRFSSTRYFYSIHTLAARERMLAVAGLSDHASVEVMTHPGLQMERELLLTDAWREALRESRLGSFADLA